ncbi:MAG: hypothetical protein ABF242_09945 [Flavobacteriales bacterium]
MKKLLIAFSPFILFISCDNGQEQKTEIISEAPVIGEKPEIDSNNCGLNFIPSKNYKEKKNQIKTLRNKFATQYKSSSDSNKTNLMKVAQSTFTSALLNEIIPHWYGTEWDFNGYTAKPNEGKIACGYFVSTTLRDMGLNLNRYDLAKKGPKDEAKSIAISPENLISFSEDESEHLLDSINNGLYFIGLDNHVGYLYKHNSITYFIHSNYLENKVMIELTKTSEAFMSLTYYLANISENDLLIEKWLTKESIKIVTDKN